MEEVDPQFVIIIGSGRSGTKFLRDVIASSRDVCCIPYDVGYVWRSGQEGLDHDEIPAEAYDPNIAAGVRRTLVKMGRRNGRGARLLVEKSVPNALRVGYVAKVVPDAKFIHLIRDGRAVVESSIRMWTAPSKLSNLVRKLRYFPLKNYRYGLWFVWNIIKGRFVTQRGQVTWGPRYKGMDDDAIKLQLAQICARQWKQCVLLASRDLKDVPPENVHTLYFERMVEGDEEIAAICDFLGLSDKEQVILNFRDKVVPENACKWKKILSPEDIEIINNETRDVLESLGYEV